jgi:hypothetical protein
MADEHKPDETPDEQVAATLAEILMSAASSHDSHNAVLHSLAYVLNETGLTAALNIECLALVFRVNDRPPSYTVAIQSAANPELAWHSLMETLSDRLQESYKERGERN